MKLKGMDTLSKHVPELNSTGGRARIIFYALTLLALVTTYFFMTDQIPTWSIDSQIIIVSLGFLVIRLFFTRKQTYLEKYKELAYRKAYAHYALPGLTLIVAAVAHAGYMNGPSVPQGWWTTVFFIFGLYMLCIGALLWVRSVFTFGADNLAMVYVYHPDEGGIVDSNIYGILRHPIYAGALRMSVGLALLNGNANAIAFAILAPLGFFGWIHLVEEKDLIEHFGESYLDYRKRVPAFWPRLRDMVKFFTYLLTGS
jgi:protein-S-isoprenylcysteine O-methyltransferase Ste14